MFSAMTSPKPKAAERKPLIRLVVGMSRAGTTGMVEALNAHPEVSAFGETKFYGISESRSQILDANALDGLKRHFKRIILRLRDPETAQAGETDALKYVILQTLDELTAPVARGEVFEAIGSEVARTTNKAYWVEKTPHHLMHLGAVFADDPEARAIIMLRAPEGFMLSYKHQGDRKRAAVRDTLHGLYNPILVALICRRYLQEARKWQAAAPNGVLVVRLEDIRTAPDNVYANVLAHFLLPQEKIDHYRISNSSFGADAKNRPELSEAERAWLGLLTNAEAQALGYPPVTYKLRPLEMLRSLGALVVWPFRNASVLFQLRRYVGAMIRRWL